MKIRSSRTKSASQKPYSPSPGAGSQRRGFRRPARPVVGACRRSNWRSYGGSTTTRRGKNPNSIRLFLAWLVGCIYIVLSNRPRRLGLCKLEGQEIKNQNYKRRPRSRKARSRISADHSRRCRAPAPFASPRRGKARQGERAHVGFSFSSSH